MGAAWNAGQGIYAMNVRGLRIERPFFNRIGRYFSVGDTGGYRSIYRHAMYLSAPNEYVVVTDAIVVDAESIGCQVRGVQANSHAEPYADAVRRWAGYGPRVEGCVFVNCAIGAVVNGPDGHYNRNICVPVGYHNDPNGWKHGQGQAMLHLGSGDCRDNLRFAGPDPTGGQSRMADLTIGPRRWYDTTTDRPWWDGPVNVARSGNRDLMAVATRAPDLRDLVEAGRRGRDVHDEMAARLRAAAPA
jgi:hypothetical protein